MEPMKTVHYWKVQAFGLKTVASICKAQAEMYQGLIDRCRCEHAKAIYESWMNADREKYQEIKDQIAEAEMMIERLEVAGNV